MTQDPGLILDHIASAYYRAAELAGQRAEKMKAQGSGLLASEIHLLAAAHYELAAAFSQEAAVARQGYLGGIDPEQTARGHLTKEQYLEGARLIKETGIRLGDEPVSLAEQQILDNITERPSTEGDEPTDKIPGTNVTKGWPGASLPGGMDEEIKAGMEVREVATDPVSVPIRKGIDGMKPTPRREHRGRTQEPTKPVDPKGAA